MPSLTKRTIILLLFFYACTTTTHASTSNFGGINTLDLSARYHFFGSTENSIISPQNAYFELNPSQNLALSLGGNWSPTRGGALWGNLYMPLSTKSEGFIGYHAGVSNITYQLGIQSSLFWDPESAIGIKGRLTLDDIFIVNHISSLEMRTNILMSKQVGKTLFFSGVSGTLFALQSSSDFDALVEEDRTTSGYVGIEQKLTSWLDVSGVYYKNAPSAVITLKAPWVALPFRISFREEMWTFFLGYTGWNY